MQIESEKSYISALKIQKEKSEVGIIDDLRVKDINNKFFDLVEKKFPWGKRNIFLLKEGQEENYKALQQSRSLAGGSSEINIEKAKENVIEQINKLENDDSIRFDELSAAFRILFHDAKYHPKSMCELGYRAPKILEYYKQKGWKVAGYDVVEMNNFLARELGYDARLYDFNSCDEDLDLSGIDLVVSYHMLEHVSNPFKAMQKVYESMKDGAFFHVEVPIEGPVPNIRYGHLYPFHVYDLEQMLLECGFHVCTFSDMTAQNAASARRVLAQKRSNSKPLRDVIGSSVRITVPDVVDFFAVLDRSRKVNI